MLILIDDHIRVWLRWSAERRGDWGAFQEGEEGEAVPGRKKPRSERKRKQKN